MMLEASVVIPVFNESSALMKTLPAVLAQTDSRQVEIIVVDNGSHDDTIQMAECFGARVLREHRNKESPYSSRNRGIESASGRVIILLDATCTPEPGWFVAGMSKLSESGASVVGGRVRFSFGSPKPTSAEWFDSMVHVQMQEAIEQHGYAMTANLFILREVFARQGLFHEAVRSGEDLRWTKAASSSGETLTYCHEAAVCKPARQWPALRQKVLRTAGGAVLLLGWRRAVSEMARNFLLPPNPLRVYSLVKKRHPAGSAFLPMQVFLISWRLRWIRALGLAHALLGFSEHLPESGVAPE